MAKSQELLWPLVNLLGMWHRARAAAIIMQLVLSPSGLVDLLDP